MSDKKKYSKFARRKVKGEHWVWLSGGSVAIGVSMIVGMVLLIGIEGTAAFWPKEVKAHVLGQARFNVGHPNHGQVWLSQDSKTVIVKDDDALRTVDDKPSNHLATDCRVARLSDFKNHAATFKQLDESDLVLSVDGELLKTRDNRSASPSEFAENAAKAIGKSSWKDLTARHTGGVDPVISHRFEGEILISPDSKQLLLRAKWREFNGQPVSLDFKKPRPATISDFRQYRDAFKGGGWQLFTTQGQPVSDEDEKVVTSQFYLDNPDKFPSPWGALNEQGEHVSIETTAEDDRLRDHIVVVGTVRSDRQMDIRQLPLNPNNGTPYRDYQLEKQPKELLIRQGNQGDGLYSRGRYFQWIRTDLPDVENVRAASPETYAETAVNTITLPGVVMIERLERGNLTGYIKTVTVDGEVLATIEKDGQEKVWQVFKEQQEIQRAAFLERYDIEKDDLGEVSQRMNSLLERLKRVRYENRDHRDFLIAMDALDQVSTDWTGQEPMDKDYSDEAAFGVAQKQWLEQIEPLLVTWDTEVAGLDLGDYEEAIGLARDLQTERAEIHANEFLPFRFKANQMRQAEKNATYTFVTTDGEEAELLLSRVVRAFRPNELGLGGKLGVYFDRVWEYLLDEPREANTEGGIWPVIVGTVVMVLVMTLLVVPFGVVAALYLREYAKQGALVSAVRIAVNNLAGVPSIVFGIFGLGFFCIMVGGTIDDLLYPELQPAPTFGGGGIMWAAFTLALLTVPVVIVSTEEALSAVPSSQREASLACGASKFQTISKIILPQALPGVLTGTILAMARGAGEVAPLMLVGAVKFAPFPPVDMTAPFVHLDRSFMHLGFHIYDVGFQSPSVDNTKPLVFATALVLIGLVAVLNIFAITLRNRLRKKFTTSHV
ncbi:MAG: phosphate ABC transporter permease PstA [Planctomycetota bacterium]|jgi:phosphate ABC transporter permease subunit PstA